MKPMQVHRDLSQLPVFKNAALTIGTFDGVHRGHQQIIHQLKTAAAAANGESIIITFEPHPREVLLPEDHGVQLLNTLEEKIGLLAEQGIDHVIVAPFTPEFSKLSAAAYIEDFLVKNFHPHTIIIGYDHHFGHNREGDIRLLESVQEKFNCIVIEIPREVVHHVGVSSTKIRHHLRDGHVILANELLGYPYFLSGAVIHGDKRGRELGYPTANLEVQDKKKLIPGEGVYAVRVALEGTRIDATLRRSPPPGGHNPQLLKGMLNIGRRPTFHEKELRIEVNIFDFGEEIYGENMTIYFIDFIRPDEKFDTVPALVAQMGKDKIAALKILGEAK